MGRVKYVFVSPLRRCLESSRLLFQEENCSGKQFIVDPKLREFPFSPNDIPIYYWHYQKDEWYERYDWRRMSKEMESPFWFFDTELLSEEQKNNFQLFDKIFEEKRVNWNKKFYFIKKMFNENKIQHNRQMWDKFMDRVD